MRKLYINDEDFFIYVAITNENSKLVNFFAEKKDEYSVMGNIYKGKIIKVLSNMNFIFVDIGDKKAGFLSENEYFDISNIYYGELVSEKEHINSYTDIYGILEKGQDIIVQVSRNARDTKGVRLTTNISIPGNFVVLFPFLNRIGISKKIQNENERTRLKSIIESFLKEKNLDVGIIARTESENVDERFIKEEIDYLNKIWKRIKKDFKEKKSPSLLYKEPSLPIKVLREYGLDNVDLIMVDSKNIYEEIIEYLNYRKEKNVNVKKYDGVESIFKYYKLESQINALYSNVVSFKKGGYFTIDYTEALTVFDVNSGKFKGIENMEESIFLMNLNAAKEIARQIILRNIGGLIVIDFIDMHKESYKNQIKKVMEEELSKDKLYFKVSDISEFGLMEIIRKRSLNSINDIFFEDCSICAGKGKVLKREILCIDYLKKIKYTCKKEVNQNILITLPNDIKNILEKRYMDKIQEYANIYKKNIILKNK